MTCGADNLKKGAEKPYVSRVDQVDQLGGLQLVPGAGERNVSCSLSPIGENLTRRASGVNVDIVSDGNQGQRMASGTLGLMGFVPTLADIAEGCAEIRAGWSPADFYQRETIATNSQVELLAAMLRPMAIEAGYVRATEAAVETVDADSTVCTPAA